MFLDTVYALHVRTPTSGFADHVSRSYVSGLSRNRVCVRVNVIMHFRIADAWRAVREGRGRGGNKPGGCMRESVRQRGTEGLKGRDEWKEHERGRRVSGTPKGRAKEGCREGRSDYLQQSKQDKLSVCISAWSGPITLFYPPGVICRFIGRTLDTLFRRYLWPRHGAARRSKVAECSSKCIGSIEKSVTAYLVEASFVATRRVKSIYCGGHVIPRVA